jgi:hypothetical protein
MDKTTLNHPRISSKEKKCTKSKQSLITGNEDAAINFTSNGKVTLFLTPHGNRNQAFPTMATPWNVTNNATNFEPHCLSHHLYLAITMTDRLYNVNPEFWTCDSFVYDILDFLSDIRLALLLGEDLTNILFPPFDPLKTIDHR